MSPNNPLRKQLLTKCLAVKSLVASLLIIFSLTGTAIGKDLKISSPQREGMSAQRLTRIDRHMRTQVEEGVMVGGLGMIARNGKIVYNQVWGMSDREAGKPMTDDAIFRIYSMTKPVTGVALMMLYEEGKFFLNDPIAKYIPELANLLLAVEGQPGETIKPKRQPTVLDLMTHTAGFSYGIFGNSDVDKLYREANLLDQKSLQDFVKALGKIPLQYEPGSRWHYSVSVDVQGYLVEVLSGMKFGEFLKKRIFEPLEMNDTSFFIGEDKLDRLAQLYSPKGAKSGNALWLSAKSKELQVASAELSKGYLDANVVESGGGGLLSTAEDYMRFSLMLLNGGELNGKRLLSPKTVELMSMNHIGDLSVGYRSDGVGFGLDFAVVLDLGKTSELGSVGEYSWGGAAGTRFLGRPERTVGWPVYGAKYSTSNALSGPVSPTCLSGYR